MRAFIGVRRLVAAFLRFAFGLVRVHRTLPAPRNRPGSALRPLGTGLPAHPSCVTTLHREYPMKRLAVAAGAVWCLSCFVAACRAADEPAFPVAWEVTSGVQSPESAYFDAASGFVFVSNIGGGGPTGKDGDGFLSKLTPDGKVVAAKWITGLNAPKGIRSSGGRLWVSDIDQLVGVDIAQGKIAERVAVPGAEFLNDVACDAQGAVYVSDMTEQQDSPLPGWQAVRVRGRGRLGEPQRTVGGRQSTGRRRLGIEQRRENSAWPSVLAGSGIGEEDAHHARPRGEPGRR